MIFCHASLPVPVVAEAVDANRSLVSSAMRVAVADVDQDRARRREGQFPESFVADAFVLGQLSILVGPVVTGVLRAVVGAVEIQLVRDNRTAGVDGEPGPVLFVPRGTGPLQRRHHVARAQLPGQLAGEAIRARLADRVDAEPARAIEVDRARAAADGRDLGDVMRRRFGGEGAEERKRDVGAVEVVDVVLPAAAGARTADGVLRILHAGNELQEIAVFLADRQRHDLLVRDAALERRRLALDQRDGRGHVHRLGHALNPQRHVHGGVLVQLDQSLPRHRLHAGEGERERVVPGRQGGEPVFAGDFGHRDPRRWEHIGSRFDRHARQHPTGGIGHFPAHRPDLLRRRRNHHRAEKQEREYVQRTGYTSHPRPPESVPSDKRAGRDYSRAGMMQSHMKRLVVTLITSLCRSRLP